MGCIHNGYLHPDIVRFTFANAQEALAFREEVRNKLAFVPAFKNDKDAQNRLGANSSSVVQLDKHIFNLIARNLVNDPKAGQFWKDFPNKDALLNRMQGKQNSDYFANGVMMTKNPDKPEKVPSTAMAAAPDSQPNKHQSLKS